MIDFCNKPIINMYFKFATITSVCISGKKDHRVNYMG